MNALEVIKTKTTNQHIYRRVVVEADSKGQLPERIELLKIGEWSQSVKNNLLDENGEVKPIRITLDDLYEFKRNFDRGVALPGNGQVGLPIDFMHNSWDKAAGWIKGLIVEEDSLFAYPVEWSKSGKEAILGGEFKCVSPTFTPASLGEWQDPEDVSRTALNVLEGAALTNIPFFSGLSPIMASNSQSENEGGVDKNVMYINPGEGEKSMVLEDIRAKEADVLTEEEKNFLVEHKDELSVEDQKKFGFEVVAAEGEVEEEQDGEETPVATPVAEPVTASKVEATVKVSAAKFAALEATAAKYENEVASKFVSAHVERGAIKADQKDSVVKMLTSKSGQDREEFEAFLNNLPENKVMASEIGSSNTADVKATDLIQAEAEKLITAATKAGKTLDIGTAFSQVLASKPELAELYQNQINGKEGN